MDKQRLNEVATMTANNNKANRKAAFNVVNALIDNNEPPTTAQLAILYSFFTPSQPAKPKTPAQWVQKAVAVKDVRYYLNNAHASGGFLRGTDGHRMHIAPIAGIFDGFYDKNTNAVDVDGTFPNVQRVIPTDSAARQTIDLSDMTAFEYTAIDHADAKPTQIVILRQRVTSNPDTEETDVQPFAVNLSYLNDALSNPAKLTRATLPPNNDGVSSMLLEFEDGSLAVVMAIRV
jgi:hypothetical protein